jgi:hypothetical protein
LNPRDRSIERGHIDSYLETQKKEAPPRVTGRASSYILLDRYWLLGRFGLGDTGLEGIGTEERMESGFR